MLKEPIPSPLLHYQTPSPTDVLWRRNSNSLYVELPPPPRGELLSGSVLGLVLVGLFAFSYLYGTCAWIWQLVFDPSEAAKLEVVPGLIFVGLGLLFGVLALRRIARVRQLMATATTPSVIEVTEDRLSVSCPHAARVLRFACPREDVADIGFSIGRNWFRISIETTSDYAVHCYVSTSMPEMADRLDAELASLLPLRRANGSGPAKSP